MAEIIGLRIPDEVWSSIETIGKAEFKAPITVKTQRGFDVSKTVLALVKLGLEYRKDHPEVVSDIHAIELRLTSLIDSRVAALREEIKALEDAVKKYPIDPRKKPHKALETNETSKDSHPILSLLTANP